MDEIDEEKLIELVRGYIFLYDVKDRKYCDNVEKEKSWSEIARKLRSTPKDCRRAWAVLRDSHRRSINRQRAYGPDSKYCKKWRYQDEMAFLVPHFKKSRIFVKNKAEDHHDEDRDMQEDGDSPQEFITNTQDHTNYEDFEKQMDIKYDRDFYGDFSMPDDVDDGLPAHSPSEFSAAATSSCPAKNSANTLLQPQRLSTCKSDEMPTTAALIKYILENDKRDSDDLEQFFTGIATTVRSFSLRDRALAKAKVFEVISKMEIETIAEHQKECNGN